MAEGCNWALEQTLVRPVADVEDMQVHSLAAGCSSELEQTLVHLEAVTEWPLVLALALGDTLVEMLVQDQADSVALLHFGQVLRAGLCFREAAKG